MNHANAIVLRGKYPAVLYRVPGDDGMNMLGTIDHGDKLMPADLPAQVVDGVEYVAVVCWVRRDEVMRCGE